MLFVKPLTISFYIIYIVCGLSDMVDGYIARKTGTTSDLGAKLDTVADFIMVTVLLVVLVPIIKPSLMIIIWIIVIGLVRIASMIVAFVKYQTFASIHTYSNKVTGMILFLFPLLLLMGSRELLMAVICVVASLSALEEFVIQLTSRDLELDRKSFFVK